MDVPYVAVPILIVLLSALLLAVCLRKGFQQLRNREQIKGSPLITFALCLLSVTLSAGLNAILLYRARHPVPGSLYEVNGHKLRLDCTGSGSPAVILEAGGGETGLMWAPVQNCLSEVTKTCSYDRAGMGWSASSPSVRDADSVAKDLHVLLQKADIRGPFVLAGASRGGLYIRAFASRFSSEVEGLVFVDSSTPLQQDNPVYKAVNRSREVSNWDLFLNQGEFILGIPRLFGACEASFPHFSEQDAALRAVSECHQSFEADAREQQALKASGAETVRTSFGTRPVLVISHDADTELREGMPPALEAVTERWQEDLMNLSSCGHRLVVLGSGHRISDTRPEVVSQAITDFVGRLRSGQVGSGFCGVTAQK